MPKSAFRNQQGFTLIELLAVMAIVAALAGFVATQTAGLSKTSRSVQSQQDATTVGAAVGAYRLDQGGVLRLSTITVPVLGEAGIEQTKNRSWPETFITSAYPDIFPPDIATVAAVSLLNQGGTASVVSVRGLLEYYNAVDFDTLEDGGYLQTKPESATQTREGFNEYLWLLRKAPSNDGNGDLTSRNVEVFKLAGLTKTELLGLVELTYERLVGESPEQTPSPTSTPELPTPGPSPEPTPTPVLPTPGPTPSPTPPGTPAPPALPPPLGVIGWWPGDGDAGDIVGANDGTLMGAAFAPGKVAQAFSLDGIDDYVYLGIPVAQGVPALTYEAWINPDDVTGTHGLVVGRFEAHQMFLADNGHLFAYRWSADGTGSASSWDTGGVVPVGTWTHVAATFDATTIKAYINGVEVGSTGYAWPLVNSGDPMLIGTDVVNGRWFDGLIDEVSVYDRALSLPEIAAIFAAGSAGKLQPAALPLAVNSTVDAIDATTGDGTCETGTPGQCTLRAAIMEANALPGANTVSLPAGTYILTISGTGEDFAATGDLDINDDLTIVGAGPVTTIIDGGALDRVFEIGASRTVEISGVTVTNGSANQGGAIFNSGELILNNSVVTSSTTTGQGGGVYTSGTLTLNVSTVSGNTSSTAGSGPGGGIFNSGSLTLVGSTVSGNSPATTNTAGGGILNEGTVDLTDSKIDSNSASHGGGVYNLGSASVTRSTISGNTGSQGSGLHNDGGVMTVVASTISGNSSFTGGGIQNRGAGGALTMTNSTISGNTAQNGGAIYNRSQVTLISTTISDNTTLGTNAAINGSLASDPAATYSLKNTIIAGNHAGPNCTGINIASQGYNLDDGSSCNLFNVTDLSPYTDPMLGPLADNGGLTWTHALLIGSPAIDAGDDGAAAGPDQRGVDRPQGAQADVGAYELVQAAPLAWGGNPEGELGNGTQVSNSSALPVSVLTGVVGLAGGQRHSMALMPDGTIQAWGRNNEGQLGDGTTTSRLTPAQVPGLTGVVAVAEIPGGSHSIALKADGTVWTWGYNDSGQLGDNTTMAKSTPAQVSGLSGIVAVSGGARHSLALKSDGTVWAWGRNFEKQLGDGTTTGRLTPVQVSGLTGIVEISAGYWHSLARKSDGTVWAWGLNSDRQLGDGTIINTGTPVQVAGLTGVIAITAGDAHSLAAKSDGTAWAWGGNGLGQLGDGTTAVRLAPVQVSGLTDVVDVAAGKNHSLALRSGGTVSAWGHNLYGQLGDGTNSDRSSPVTVGGLTDAVTIAAGEVHSLAAQINP